MKAKKEEKIVIKSVFKNENLEFRKIYFNKQYKAYINYCENKI